MNEQANKKTERSPNLKNKHTDDLVDHYWGSISYLQALIKSSELKAGLVLSFYGILLNLIYQSKANIAAIEFNILIKILLIVWLIATLVSIYFCVRCFMPRIEGKFDNNMFFFKILFQNLEVLKHFQSISLKPAVTKTNCLSNWVSKSILSQKLPIGNLKMYSALYAFWL